jgi:hypothetical protein
MANTSLIGLTLPATGTLSGQWGDTINNAISQIVDVAVAGTQTISTDADITLTLTTGTYASTGLTGNSSQYAVILWTATGTVTRNITAPAQSKTYVVINKTGGTQSIVIRGAGPTTGVTVPAGTRAIVAWDGSDFVNVGGGSAAGSNTQVQFNSSGSFGASANMTWDGTSFTATNHVATANVSGSSNKGAFSYGTLGYSDVNHVLTMSNSVNSYTQMEIQNTNTGSSASSDVIVANNNTTASTYYGDFGMNSSGWAGTGAFDSPNNVYLTSTTADIAIGSTTANNLLLATNATERLRVTSAGAWGLSGANYGTAGQVLTSGGSGAAPTWAAAAGGISQAKSTMLNFIFSI